MVSFVLWEHEAQVRFLHPRPILKNMIYNSDSDDWLIVDNFSKDQVLLFKNSINKLIDNFNLKSDITGKSTKGLNAQQFDLFQHITDISHVVKIVQTKVENVLLQKIKSVKSAWTVLGYENSFHTVHKHNTKIFNSHVATVTYLNMPNEYDEHRTGNFYAILQDANKVNFNFLHEPKEGDILIFPVWVYHGTMPQPKGLRHTLSIDFELDKEKSRHEVD